MHSRILRLTLCLFLVSPLTAYAADDPSIQGQLRTDIQASMQTFITQNTIDGQYRHYDPVSGTLRNLKPGKVHAGIVRKGDFYVSCADFTDAAGNTLDLDFLVLPTADGVRTVQAIVHKVDGNKRPYDLESKNH